MRKNWIIIVSPFIATIIILFTLGSMTFLLRPHPSSNNITLEFMWSIKTKDIEGTWDYSTLTAPFTAGDVDGDGKLEIVACVEEDLFVINAEDGTILWYMTLNISMFGSFSSTPLLIDVDKDGLLDIIVSYKGLPIATYFAVRGYDGKVLWTKYLPMFEIPSENMALIDINNDGIAEVIFCASDFDNETNTEFVTFYIVNPTNGTTKIEIIEKNNRVVNYNGFAVSYVDNDSYKDIIYSTKTGIAAYSPVKHSILWHKMLFTSEEVSEYSIEVGIPLIVDAGDRVIAILPTNPSCFAFDAATGEELWTFEYNNYTFGPFPLAAGDINNDGRLEVIISSFNNHLFVLDALTGRICWSRKFPETYFQTPTLIDCDGDKELDIAVGGIIVGEGQCMGNFYILRGRDGKILASYKLYEKWYRTTLYRPPFPCLAGIRYCLITDLDLDGNPDFLLGYKQWSEDYCFDNTIIVALKFLTDVHPPSSFLRVFWPGEGGTFNYTYNSADVDGDHDFLSYYTESYIGTNPYSFDSDGDLLPDGYEYLILGTNPLSSDSDSDGIADTFEDLDHDGYCSLEEYRHGTLPLFFDSDSDLLPDGYDPFPLFPDGWFYYSTLLLVSSSYLSFRFYRKFYPRPPLPH